MPGLYSIDWQLQRRHLIAGAAGLVAATAAALSLNRPRGDRARAGGAMRDEATPTGDVGRLLARPGYPAATVRPGLHPLRLDPVRDALLFVPAAYRPAVPTPFVVSLHGAGGDAESGLYPLRDLADEAGLILLSPASRGRTWDMILGDYGPDVAFIDRALNVAFARCYVDPEQLAVAGFSDGASYALSLGIANGDLFRQVLAFSPGFAAPPAQRGWPRFFVSHGSRDDVLPIDRTSRRVVPMLRDTGYDVRYEEFAGPHTVPPDIAREAVAWFLTGTDETVAPAGSAVPNSIAGPRSPATSVAPTMPLTLTTFGDSILDSGGYNELGLDPGRLLVRNDDRLFPEFRGRDLTAHGPVRLDHRAVDGATVDDLPLQARGLRSDGSAVAVVTIGGNDLLRGLLVDDGPGLAAFASSLDAFLRALPIRPVLLGNVYDPTFGDDTRNFTGVDPALARANHRRLNAAIAELADRYGTLVDLHAHFLSGDPSWFTHAIEPSLRGASEVRRCFLPHILDAFAPTEGSGVPRSGRGGWSGRPLLR